MRCPKLSYSSKLSAQNYRTWYGAANDVGGPPRSSNTAAGYRDSVNIWNLLWLFSLLIIWTEQKTIHTSTFPNTLTPKMAEKRDLSFRSLIAITAKFNLHWLPNEGRYWLSWKAVNRYKFSTPDEDKTFSGSFSFGFENMMTSREETLYPLSKIIKTTTMIPCRRFSSRELPILTSYASKHACHLVCKFTTYLFIFCNLQPT